MLVYSYSLQFLFNFRGVLYNNKRNALSLGRSFVSLLVLLALDTLFGKDSPFRQADNSITLWSDQVSPMTADNLIPNRIGILYLWLASHSDFNIVDLDAGGSYISAKLLFDTLSRYQSVKGIDKVNVEDNVPARLSLYFLDLISFLGPCRSQFMLQFRLLLLLNRSFFVGCQHDFSFPKNGLCYSSDALYNFLPFFGGEKSLSIFKHVKLSSSFILTRSNKWSRQTYPVYICKLCR